MRAVATELGIKKISCHSLRRSYATHLLPACALHADREAGVDLMELQHILGHASVLTISKYTHLTSETKKNTFRTINRLINGIDIRWGGIK